MKTAMNLVPINEVDFKLMPNDNEYYFTISLTGNKAVHRGGHIKAHPTNFTHIVLDTNQHPTSTKAGEVPSDEEIIFILQNMFNKAVEDKDEFPSLKEKFTQDCADKLRSLFPSNKKQVVEAESIKGLRDKFFHECTERYPDITGSTLPRVSLAPHDLFEWFKPFFFSHKEDVGFKIVGTPTCSQTGIINDFVRSVSSQKESDAEEEKDNKVGQILMAFYNFYRQSRMYPTPHSAEITIKQFWDSAPEWKKYIYYPETYPIIAGGFKELLLKEKAEFQASKDALTDEMGVDDLKQNFQSIIDFIDHIIEEHTKLIDNEGVSEEVSEEWFINNGFTKRGGVVNSFSIETHRDDFHFKELSFMYNNDTHEKQWYAMFSERDQNAIHRADVVCLRRDIKYTSQIKSLITALSIENKK